MTNANNGNGVEKKQYYVEHREKIDNVTGEVLSTDVKKLSKYKTFPEFVMVFANTLPAIIEANLTTGETKVLAAIMSKFISYGNSLNLSSDARNVISKMTKLKRTSISNAIIALKKKGMIVEIKEVIDDSDDATVVIPYLNPHIFGKSNFIDLEKLQVQVKFNYNFKDFTVEKIQETKATYEGLDELKNTPHKVVEANEYIEGNSRVQEIIVAEADKADFESGDVNLFSIEDIKKDEINPTFVSDSRIKEERLKAEAEAEKAKAELEKIKVEAEIWKTKLELIKLGHPVSL
jgi:hypothetical protein